MTVHGLNMAEGNIKNQLITIAVPLIICDFIQQLYNTIDAIIIGRYVSDLAFAALGMAGSLMNLFFFLVIGVCTGISVIFAQFFGQKDYDSFRKEAFTACVFGGAFTLLLSFFGMLFLEDMLYMLNTPTEIFHLAKEYLNVILGGLLFTFFFNLEAAVLRAVGNTKIAVAVLFSSVVTNVALAYLFVAYFGWGISGAGMATVISHLIAGILFFVYIKKYFPELLWTKKDMVIDKSLFKLSFNYGMVTALHQCSLYFGKILVQGAVNTGGTHMISAFTAGTRLEAFANSFGSSGAAAVSIFVAQNLGANNQERALQGFKKGMVLLLRFGVLISVIMIAGAELGITYMIGTPSPSELLNGVSYLRWVFIFYVFNYVGCIFVGLFRGAGMVSVPVIGTILQMIPRITISYMFIGTFGLAAVGVGSGFGWIVINIFQYAVYKKVVLGKMVKEKR